MNTLTFVTYNIEPAQWLDFAHAAAVKLSPKDDPPQKPLIPYILVSSASISADYFTSTEATERLNQTIESELAGFTRPDLHRLFNALVDRKGNNRVHPLFFIALNAESVRERKALVVQRDGDWRNEEDMEPEPWPDDETITERTVWRWYRVPFEKVWDYVALMSSKGRWEDADQFLEENIFEYACPVPRMEN